MDGDLPADQSLVTNPAGIVEAFLNAALRDRDFDVVGALIADGAVWENVGYPTLRGGQRIVTTFRSAAARLPWMRWDVNFHRTATAGTTVLTERTDSVLIGPFRADFWVVGVFELRDGKIDLWRDYFDVWDLAKGLLRGLLALPFASRQRPR